MPPSISLPVTQANQAATGPPSLRTQPPVHVTVLSAPGAEWTPSRTRTRVGGWSERGVVGDPGGVPGGGVRPLYGLRAVGAVGDARIDGREGPGQAVRMGGAGTFSRLHETRFGLAGPPWVLHD